MAINKVSEVLNFIKDNPNTDITEIISYTKINKKTIENILLELLSYNIIIADNKKYSLSTSFCNKQKTITDTYFNVDIPKEHKQKIYCLFKVVEEYWQKYNKTKPTKTQMQKLIVEINRKLNLGLPVVWYRFGQITPVVYNPEQDYLSISEIQEIDITKIQEIVNQNQKYTSNQMRDKQYKINYGGIYKVYQTKQEMEKRLLKNDFKYIEDNFQIFFENVPYFMDENKTINRFFEITQEYNNLDKKYQEDGEFKSIYFKLFNIFWNIVAIFNFKGDLWNYYMVNNIKKERIDECDVDLIKLKDEFNDLKEMFYSKSIPLMYKDDFLYKKMIGEE